MAKRTAQPDILSTTAAPISEFVNPSVFAKREPVTVVESIEWIRQHLAFKNVNPKDCPDAATWHWFHRVRTSSEDMRVFYEKHIPKVIPSKAELSSAQQFEDDGRKQLRLLDKWKAEHAES